jgi:hypothetical protein
MQAMVMEARRQTKGSAAERLNITYEMAAARPASRIKTHMK